MLFLFGWIGEKDRLLQSADESVGVKTYKGNSKPAFSGSALLAD